MTLEAFHKIQTNNKWIKLLNEWLSGIYENKSNNKSHLKEKSHFWHQRFMLFRRIYAATQNNNLLNFAIIIGAAVHVANPEWSVSHLAESHLVTLPFLPPSKIKSPIPIPFLPQIICPNFHTWLWEKWMVMLNITWIRSMWRAGPIWSITAASSTTPRRRPATTGPLLLRRRRRTSEIVLR